MERTSDRYDEGLSHAATRSQAALPLPGPTTPPPAPAARLPLAATDLLLDLNHWRALCDSLPNTALFLVTVEGAIAYWSQGAQALTGFAPEALVGQPVSVLKPPDERRRRPRDEALWQATRLGRWQEQGWRRRQDGSCFWAQVVLTALRTEAGDVQGFAGVLSLADLGYARLAGGLDAQSARPGAAPVAGEPLSPGAPEAAWQALARQSCVLRAAMGHLKTAVLILDGAQPGAPIVMANPMVAEMTGYDLDELLGRSGHVLAGPATESGVLQTLDKAIHEARPFQGVLLNYRKDGSPFWNEWNVAPMRDERGQPVGVVSTLEDVTDRVRAQAAWRDGESRLRQLAVSEVIGVCVSTSEGEIVEANNGFLHMLGYTQDDIQSGSVHWGLLLPVSLDAQRRTSTQLLSIAAVMSWEATLRHRNGEPVTVLMEVMQTAGSLRQYLTFMFDITPIKRAQREREQYLERERQSRVHAEAAARRMQHIQAITDVALSHLESENLITALLERITTLLGCDSTRLWLLSHEGRYLTTRATYPPEAAETAPRTLPLGNGLVGRIAATREAARVDDLSQHESGSIFAPVPVRSFIGAPLLVDGRATGVLCASCRLPGLFTEDDLLLLEVAADRTAAALERNRLFQVVRAGEMQMQDLSRRLLDVQEAERQHIARELHDEIGQVLTAVKFGLQSVTSLKQPEALEPLIGELLGTVDDAICQVRQLSVGLRPPVLDLLGLVAALREYADRLAQHLHLKTHIHADELQHRPPPAVETACFRVAQEALTNIARHARADRVEVTVRERAGLLYLTVTDNGAGFDVAAARRRAERGESLGLRSMEQRALLAGGQFDLQSRPGRGTRLRATFPLDGAPREAVWTETGGTEF